jgi:Glycosyl hydrolases family 39
VRKRLAVVVCVAVACGAATAAWSADSRTAAPPRAIRIGGIDAVSAIRPWRYTGPNPDGWWCRPGFCRDVTNGTVFVDKEVRLSARLHVRIVRLDFPWAFIQPTRGTYDWRRADYIVRALRTYKLQIHAVLAYTPSWAGETQASPPSAPDFSAFARAFAKRYRRSIRYFELWNEPDLQRYWTGSNEQFVKTIVVPGYRAIRRAAPAGRVIVGPSSANRAWLEDLYRFGGGKSFDVMSWHDYSANASILSNAGVVQSVLRAHGQARKPIWLGEYGFEEPGLDDNGHAGLLTQILTSKAPFAVAEWYALRDDHPMTCCPPKTIETSTYGVLTADYRPKKSFGVMQSLLRPR